MCVFIVAKIGPQGERLMTRLEICIGFMIIAALMFIGCEAVVTTLDNPGPTGDAIVQFGQDLNPITGGWSGVVAAGIIGLLGLAGMIYQKVRRNTAEQEVKIAAAGLRAVNQSPDSPSLAEQLRHESQDLQNRVKTIGEQR